MVDFSSSLLARSGSRLAKMFGNRRANLIQRTLEFVNPDTLASARSVGEVAEELSRAATEALTRVTSERTQIITFGTVIDLNIGTGLGEGVDIFDNSQPEVVRTWGMKPGTQSPFNGLAVRTIELVRNVRWSGASFAQMEPLLDRLAEVAIANLRVVVSNADDQEFTIATALTQHGYAFETTTFQTEYFRQEGNFISDPPGLDLVSSDDAISAYINTPGGASLSSLSTEIENDFLTITFYAEAL